MGTLLQLDSGEIGVVVDHDEKARLKPTIMVVADEFGKPIEDWRIVKLSQAKSGDGANGEKAAITKVMRDLSADNLDLDMQKIQDKYQELRTDSPKKGSSGLLSKLLRR